MILQVAVLFTFNIHNRYDMDYINTYFCTMERKQSKYMFQQFEWLTKKLIKYECLDSAKKLFIM